VLLSSSNTPRSSVLPRRTTSSLLKCKFSHFLFKIDFSGSLVASFGSLIAWATVGGHSVIPKSVKESRIISNFKQIELSKEDIEAINKIEETDGTRRYNLPRSYSPRWDTNVFGEKEEKEAKYQVKIGA
jgi:hypothetical protein